MQGSFLHRAEAARAHNHFIQEYFELHSIGEVAFLIVWDAFKATARGSCISGMH